MADEIIRPFALPNRENPVASEKVPADNGSTVGGATIEALVLAGRPTASQVEAEAGVNALKAMTPLTTKQAVTARIGVDIASKAQGDKADSAIQSIGQGSDITVDATDPQNPIVSYTGAGVTDGNKGAIVVSDSGTKWELARDRKTVALLIADTVFSYTAGEGKTLVAPGDIVTAQGFRYEVAASDATDHDVVTAGAVKLYALPGEDGYYEYIQLGAVLDGVTDNATLHQQAVDRGYPLAHRTDGVLYISTPAVTTSTLWQFKGKSNGTANWTIADNPARVLCPNGFVKSASTLIRSKVVSDGMAFVGGVNFDSTSIIFDDGKSETTVVLTGGLEFHLFRNVFWYCGCGANAYNCWNSVARDNNFQSGGTFLVVTQANDTEVIQNMEIGSKSLIRWGQVAGSNYNCNILRNQINVSSMYTGTEIPLAVNFCDNYVETWSAPSVDYVVKVRSRPGSNTNGLFADNTMQDSLNALGLFLIENEHSTGMVSNVLIDNNELRVGGLWLVRMGDSTATNFIQGIVVGSRNRTSGSGVPVLSYPKAQPLNVGDYSFIVENNSASLSVATNVPVPFTTSVWGVPAPQSGGDVNSTFFNFPRGMFEIDLICDISYTNNVNSSAVLSLVDGSDTEIRTVNFSMIGDGASPRRKQVRLTWAGAFTSATNTRRFRINTGSAGATLIRATLKVTMIKDTAGYVART